MLRLMFILFFMMGTNPLVGQKLMKFSLSECLQNCDSDSSKIHEIKKEGDLTIIKLRTYASCNGNLAGGFKMKKDTLNLEFWVKPDKIWKDKQGRTMSIVSISDCNCLFDFVYHIKGLIKPILEKRIKVNGQTLWEIDKENIWIEGEID